MKRVPGGQMTDDDLYSLLEPPVALFFKSAFKGFTDCQRNAIPAIMEKRNTLISSQTGSGKTLAAFASALNMLFACAREGTLEDRVYVVYVSPLRALANDIQKNLLVPLERIQAYGEGADIRVLVRSGDTPPHKRTLMRRSPPHILITTPETLAIVLNAPLFSRFLHNVTHVIVDEIHALCDSKRGVHLSLSLERLQRISPGIVRIGLSATQAPLDTIARFLAGAERDVHVVSVPPSKDFDSDIILPSETMTEPYEALRERMIERLCGLVATHKTTLIFTNTRSSTEGIVHSLRKRGVAAEPHHGSMSREERVRVEDRLKRGELSCVVTSTSLELGIDVGSVDLVVQVGSPKSVSKALQRIGRANHAVGGRSKARFVVFDRDDLAETSALLSEAHRGNIDRTDIPRNCLDVLAQHVVGMALEKEWGVEEAFSLVRKSFPYSSLARQDFDSVLSFLACGDDIFRPRIRRERNAFAAERGARMLYLANIGTIPESTTLKVVHEGGILVGTLSESFVSRLSEGDIFVLGGKTLEFLYADREKICVRNAAGKKPTIPSWSGEAMPRSFDLSCAMGRERRRIFGELSRRDPETPVERYHAEQLSFGEPSDTQILFERYLDKRGQMHLIVHSVFGRRVNEALAHVAGQNLRGQGIQFKTSVCDDGFFLVFPPGSDVEAVRLLTPSSVGPSLEDTELFRTRFRHVASRSLAIVRNWKGRRMPLRAQKARSLFIMKNIDSEHVLMRETRSEILSSYMDYPRACAILADIEQGKIGLRIAQPSDNISPFALNILLQARSDLLTLEEKDGLRRELQGRIHSSLFQESSALFSREELGTYFSGGEVAGETLAERIASLLSKRGPLTIEEICHRLDEEEGEVAPLLSGSDDIISGCFAQGPSPQYMLREDKSALLRHHGFSEEELAALLECKHFSGFGDASEVFERYGAVGSLFSVFGRAGFGDVPTVSARIAGKRKYVREEDLGPYILAYRKEGITPREISALDAIEAGTTVDEFRKREGGEMLDKLERNLYVVRDGKRLLAAPAPSGDEGEARTLLVARYLSSCGPSTLEEIREATRFSHDEVEGSLESLGTRRLRIFGTLPYDAYCVPEDYEALRRGLPPGQKVHIIDAGDPFLDKVRYQFEAKYPGMTHALVKGGRLSGALDAEMSEDSLVINGVECSRDMIPDVVEEIFNLFRFMRRKGARQVRIKSMLGAPASDSGAEAEGGAYIIEKGRLMRCTRREVSEESFGHMLLVKGGFGTRAAEEDLYRLIASHLFLTESGCASRIPNFGPSLLEALARERKVATMFFKDKRVLVAAHNIPLMNLLAQGTTLTPDEGEFLASFPDIRLARGYGKIFENLCAGNHIISFVEYERNGFERATDPGPIVSLLLSRNPPLTARAIEILTGLPHHTVAECLEKYPSYFSGEQVFTDQLLEGESSGIILLDEDDPLSLLFGAEWDASLKLPRGKKKYIAIGGAIAGGMALREERGGMVIEDLVFFERFRAHWLALLEEIGKMGEVAIRRVNGREMKSAGGWE